MIRRWQVFAVRHAGLGPYLLAPGDGRAAPVVTAAPQAKRRRGFDDVTRIGLVLDGTTVGRCPTVRCPWGHPVIVPHTDAAGVRGAIGTVVGQQHTLSLLSVVGGALMLPVDVEPYGPGDSEHAASLRLLQRGVAALGPRFAPPAHVSCPSPSCQHRGSERAGRPDGGLTGAARGG